MPRILGFLKSILGLDQSLATPSVENLRQELKTRYHNFQLLITAHNRALAVMADMDAALCGNRIFGMSFISSRVTAVSVAVYRIIQLLDALCPGKYPEVMERHRFIQAALEECLRQRTVETKGGLIMPMADIDFESADVVGSKMASLGAVRRELGLAAPDGFVVTAGGYRLFMEHNDLQPEINKRLLATAPDDPEEMSEASQALQRMIMEAQVPPELDRTMRAALHDLAHRAGGEVRLSLRPSAVGEEAFRYNFAGQFRSILNIGPDRIGQAYKEIVASKYSLAAMTYRLNRGLRDDDVAMCVGCLAMVDAVAGGLMSSRDPVDVRALSVHIDATWGLPKSVLDGTCQPDRFEVTRCDHGWSLTRELAPKREYYVCDPAEGVCVVEAPEDVAAKPSLTDEEALELARTASRLDELFKGPVDVEWVIDQQGRLFILQCRPLKLAEAVRSRRETSHDGQVLAKGRITASPGVGAGEVFAVESDLDIVAFPEGAVLVSRTAEPRWTTVVAKAAALVTAGGSGSGPLAIVAREFHVPALFGVDDLSALSQGRLVTVDADGLSVLDGREEGLVEVRHAVPDFLSDSPVRELLASVRGFIHPLNLDDPDSPRFRPANCQTYHDIIRYCHEMAVFEMFNLGCSRTGFSARMSKQLMTDIAMKWWVLNLDDGFTREVEGRFVRLEDISCRPMLAVWDGIRAFPWEGPPPVDTRGFMAIMYQTATNPDLDGSSQANYGSRNYFMISRDYMTLTSRFGYHLTSIEALVGERDSENYVGFQFKGGAAEFERRQRRAHFVAHILQEWGFSTDVQEDAVFARIDGGQAEHLLSRLKILGYLIIHTRQLDMIMKLRNQVDKYREKLGREIALLLAGRTAQTPSDQQVGPATDNRNPGART